MLYTFTTTLQYDPEPTEPVPPFQGRDGSLIERITHCGPEPKLPLPKGCVVANLSQLQDNSTVLEYPQVKDFCARQRGRYRTTT